MIIEGEKTMAVAHKVIISPPNVQDTCLMLEILFEF